MSTLQMYKKSRNPSENEILNYFYAPPSHPCCEILAYPLPDSKKNQNQMKSEKWSPVPKKKHSIIKNMTEQC